MALTRATIQAVDLSSTPIERYRDDLGDESWTRFQDEMARFSARVRGRVVWNVNSTGRGGGVAELLAALIPYDLGASVDERWVVIEGDPEFFDLTKRIHTMLHGVAAEDSDLTGGDRREYEQTLGRNAAALMELMKPGDLA